MNYYWKGRRLILINTFDPPASKPYFDVPNFLFTYTFLIDNFNSILNQVQLSFK